MRIRSRAVLAVAVALTLVGLSSAARAESKSWTAAKGVLPAGVSVIVGGNITTIRKTSMYQAIVPNLLKQNKEVDQGFKEVKSGCGIDIETSITDVVIAVDDSEKGVLIATLASGVDEAKALACLTKMAEKEKKGKITSKKSGNIVEYAMEGEKDKIYLAWLAKDVIALAFDPEDKALLEKFTTGKGAALKSGDLSKAVGKTNTNAALWFAVAKKTPYMQSGTMKATYGAVDVAGGIISLDANVVVSSEAEAKKAATDTQTQIVQASGQMPPEMQKIIKGIKVSSSADTVNFKASITEKEAMALIGMAMTQM